MADKPKISVVLADVDGSLVNEENVLTKRAHSAVKTLRNAGSSRRSGRVSPRRWPETIGIEPAFAEALADQIMAGPAVKGQRGSMRPPMTTSSSALVLPAARSRRAFPKMPPVASC
jgi:hypothetical protein